MPYAIRLPDGTLVQNIPDDLSPEDAKKRIIAAGLIKAPVPPETTFLGQVKEGFKGLIPGAVGLVESAATGASALLPEKYETPVREKIASIAGAAKAPFAAAPGYEETVGRKLGEAVGSTVPFLAAGPLGLAGRVGAVGLGVGAGAGEARTRAEKEGATAEQRGTATALGVIPGAMEVFAPFRILSRVPEAATAQGVQLVKRALVAGGEEAAQEAASGFAQNLIAKGVYKPEQELIEGLGEQAAYGGATGAIVQGLMDLALGRRARGAVAPAPGAQPGETQIERAAREAAEKAPPPAPAPEPPAPPAEPIPPVAETPATTGEPPAEPIPPVAETPATAGEPPAGEPPAEPTPPIEEPKVRKAGEPAPLPDVLDSATVKTTGYPRGKVHDSLVGKSITDPEVRRILEEAKERTPSAKTAAKIDAFLARLPEPAAPPAPPPVVETAAPAVPPAEPAVETPVGGAPAELPTTQPRTDYWRPNPYDPENKNTWQDTFGFIHYDVDYNLPGGGRVKDLVEAAQSNEIQLQFVNSKGEEKILAVYAAKGKKPYWRGAGTMTDAQIEAGLGSELYNAIGSEKLETEADYDALFSKLRSILTKQGAPSVATTPTEPETGGTGAPVAGGPTAVTPTEGIGAPEPTGVVPSVADVGQPAGGEGTKPAAVGYSPAPVESAGRTSETKAAAPEYAGTGKKVQLKDGTDVELIWMQDAFGDNAIVPLGPDRTPIGDMYFVIDPEGKFQPTVDVDDAYQRKGLATAMYDFAEELGANFKLEGGVRTPEGQAFREAREKKVAPAPAPKVLKGSVENRVKALNVNAAVGGVPDPKIVRSTLESINEPKMARAVLYYLGVDQDGNFLVGANNLPQTPSAQEAGQMAGLGENSGDRVKKVAKALGITGDVRKKYQASQTDIIVTGKAVSESGTGARVEPQESGALTGESWYEPIAKKGLKGANHTELARAVLLSQRYLGTTKENESAAMGLMNEAQARAKRPEFAAAFRKQQELLSPDQTGISRGKSDEAALLAEPEYEEDIAPGQEEAVEEDKPGREEGGEPTYRTIPQSPVVTNRASHAELEKVVSDIEKTLGGKVAVTILDDVTDVDAKQKPGSRAGATIKGGIYLFRSGIAKGIEGQKTIFHELFHKGLKNLLPEAEYRAMMNKFYSQSAEIRAMADAYLASDVGKADTKNLSPQDARVLAVEESLAEVAEKTKLKPTMVRQVGNFLARVADRLGMPQLARAIRTMGLNEQEKFIRDALQAGLGAGKAEEGAARFRVGEEQTKSIGKFGPIKNASAFYWSDNTGVAVQVFDQDLINSGVKSSRAVVDQFDLDISKDGKVAEIHTHGVPPGASAVLSKYKNQISRVKPVGFSGDAYYKFAPGSFSNAEIRNLIRSLRDIAVQEGVFDKVETVKIKRATGATAGRAPREISRDTAMRFRTTAITPEAKKAAAEADAIGERERSTLTQKVGRELEGNVALRLREKFTDSLAPLEDFFVNAYGGQVRTAGGRLNPMVLVSRALDALRVSKAVQEQGGLGRADGLIVATELKNDKGESISYQGVLKRIADAAKAEGKTYEEYQKTIDNVLYGHREFNLRERNKTLSADEQVDLLLDDKQIDALEAAFQKDEFIKGISTDLDTIRFNLLDTLVDTGRISKEQAQDYKDAIGYIPFERIGDYENAWAGATRGANRGVAALKKMRRLEGSSRKSTSVVENFSGLVDWATKEAMKNEATSRALEDMVLLGAAKRGPKRSDDSPGGEVQVFKDGKQETFYVPDPAHLVAFSIADPQLSKILKAAQKASQVLRAGVTSMPPFAIKQVFDDVVRAYAYAGVKNNAALVKNVLFNFPKNWMNEILQRKPAGIRELEALGIVGTFDFSQQGGNLQNILEGAGAKKEGLGSTILRVMEAGAKASDVAVRQAVYNQVLKETGDKAQAESAAREIINFSRRGSSKMMGQMISIIPFFNAYARGMDKLATAAAGKVVGQTTGTARSMFYSRMAVLTSMGLAYALMMQDDEEYNKLPDHVRDTNWILPYGKELGFTPAIPIPADLAFFFKAIPERVVRYYKYQGTDEERAAMEVLGELTKRGIDVFSSPNITPQILRPLFENFTNYSWFLGRPLESQAQLKLRPFERYGTGTSDAMKAVAAVLEDVANATGIETFAVSPIKLENALRGLMGTAAGLSLSVADMMVNPNRTDRPLHQQLVPQLTGASAVMKNPVGTRYMDEIYSLESRVEQVYNTSNRMKDKEPEKADKFLEDNIGMYEIRPALRAVMEQIRNLNKMAMDIDKDTTLSPEQRRKEIDELRAEQNEIARVVFSLRKEARDIQRGF